MHSTSLLSAHALTWNHIRPGCYDVTTGIGIGTQYRHRWRSKVSVSVVSVNSGIGLSLLTLTMYLARFPRYEASNDLYNLGSPWRHWSRDHRDHKTDSGWFPV